MKSPLLLLQVGLFETDSVSRVTVASVLRLVYLVHRLYYEKLSDSPFTQFQVNIHS